jgi:hemerythrin-like domain-containing protein
MLPRVGKGDFVKKASEYRHHAAECRALAQGMKDEGHRAQLLVMAQTWESLAEVRERRTRRPEGAREAGASRQIHRAA